MLFILTGSVQSGKTRWLSALVEELTKEEFLCYGVLSPGIWKVQKDKNPLFPTYEKRGIAVDLLPTGKRLLFATRRDLLTSPTKSTKQSDEAGLCWAIEDNAIAQVNQHFTHLNELAHKGSKPDLLIIDELGRLELEENKGFSQAIELLREETKTLFPQVLVVVRKELVEQAKDKLSGCRKTTAIIHPDESGRQAILTTLSMQKQQATSLPQGEYPRI